MFYSDFGINRAMTNQVPGGVFREDSKKKRLPRGILGGHGRAAHGAHGALRSDLLGPSLSQFSRLGDSTRETSRQALCLLLFVCLARESRTSC